MHHLEGILVRLPQNMEKWQMFPTWCRKRTWRSNLERKAQGPAAGQSLLPVSTPCFPALTQCCKVLALHRGYLPKLLFHRAPCQDVLLSPLKDTCQGHLIALTEGWLQVLPGSPKAKCQNVLLPQENPAKEPCGASQKAFSTRSPIGAKPWASPGTHRGTSKSLNLCAEQETSLHSDVKEGVSPPALVGALILVSVSKAFARVCPLQQMRGSNISSRIGKGSNILKISESQRVPWVVWVNQMFSSVLCFPL